MLARDSGIALLHLAQQALFGRDQRAAAIDVDAAALEHDAVQLAVDAQLGLPERHAQALGNLGAGGRVELPVVVLGPGVEAPARRGDGRQSRLLRRIAADEDRTVVARPDAVGRDAEETERCRRSLPRRLADFLRRSTVRAHQQLPGFRLVCFIVDQDVDPLDAREVTNDLGVDPRNRLELARPVGAIVRPRDPGGVVRLPLGGHAIAERGGRLGSVSDVFGMLSFRCQCVAASIDL